MHNDIIDLLYFMQDKNPLSLKKFQKFPLICETIYNLTRKENFTNR